ncbi:MAG: 3-oxosteroid 1-dehydrogenase [Thermomicrobiales bacterium]|jgi:succinate dehydrogenase/fumarate reductase flavoprotein subunit|nr:3-oxosteroid 1-dehydrogenase [Thermomicrobiales bacterium]
MPQHEDLSPTKVAPSFRVSRRNFLRAAGAGAAGTALAAGTQLGAVPFGASRAAAQAAWDQEADIVVVGSGAAAFTAAVMAAELGSKVIMLEKAETIGGTTGKSGGGYWIPNNPHMREAGLTDPREDALRYMVKYSYRQYYNPDDPEGRFGAFPNDFALIEAMYDNASPAVEKLAEIGALQSFMSLTWDKKPTPDYMEHYPENKAPRGRLISVKPPEGATGGAGPEMIRQLSEAAEKRQVPVLTGHRVERVVVNDAGAVVGVEAATADGATVAVRGRKAVIFGSGDFTHDKWMVLHYQRGPMFGGCAVPTNEGDFVRIAGAVGAKMGNMTGAFHGQVVLEQALEFSSTPSDIFFITGDTSILVNRFGVRVVNEKRNYNDRTQAHFNWDATRGEWTNEVLFWIYDQRTADFWGGGYPIPAAGVEAPYLITGQTLAELSDKIDARLAEYTGRTGGVRLDSSFASNLDATVARFNAFARDGKDPDFLRGDFAYDREWPTSPPSNPDFKDAEWPSPDQPNITMYPIRSEGPYYAIAVGGGTLTTNGGPVINPKAQVVNTQDEPIAGLYGAGTCIASPSASAYWGGGSTLGPAVTFGYIAALNAHEESVKEV